MSASIFSMLLKNCRIQFSFLFLFLIFLPFASALSFNLSVFNQTTPSLIEFQGDAFLKQQIIELTKNNVGDTLNSNGRAVLNRPLILWDSVTGKVTNFTTRFSFKISSFTPYPGDGFAFFLSPYPSSIPNSSAGGALGLLPSYSALDASQNKLVAVEFDTYQNDWDPSPRQPGTHIGIDVNSIRSATYVNLDSNINLNGSTFYVSVSYNSASKNLSVIVAYNDNKNPFILDNLSLSHVVDLREILPNEVAMGFSGATGSSTEIHELFSWEFSSTLETPTKVNGPSSGKNNTPVAASPNNYTPVAASPNNYTPVAPSPNNYTLVARKKGNFLLFIGLASGVGVALIVFGLVWFIIWWKKATKHAKQRENLPIDNDDDDDDEDDFEGERGPKRLSFMELIQATNNFSEEGKLGEGGFGTVYKGLLNGQEVAIKRISAESRQGKKEYISEVKIISQLRHRNLVQLVGWCHDKEAFLLAYKFMPNGSLDSHLYTADRLLYWPLRCKIAIQLASALMYLHEEWEQCVVHRDIKPSNVMLDLGFNAKLGDFGLARLIDPEIGSQTTILAGTLGYMAPEILDGGRAIKESDVYSFGVVALEIACGRKPIELGKPRLVDWVWELYGKGCILEAADESLHMDFDEKEMECLMVVGLCCAHPYPNKRPSIRQAVNALNYGAPLPELPLDMPILVPSKFDGSSSGKNSASTTANSLILSTSSG